MIHPPFLLYLGAAPDALAIKTARGVAHWRPEKCAGERATSATTPSLGLRALGYEEAAALGVRTMLIGVANRGGVMSDEDEGEVLAALHAGLDIVSGLHQRLKDRPRIKSLAERLGRALHDVREPPSGLLVGTGARRKGRRLLTVGADCSVGKMYASLAFERDLRRRGVACDFRATGQTGIMIAGGGIPVDAVVADFISGAVEMLSPERHDNGWDIIEGQGSLHHPSYAGVSLGLLHGAQPDAIVVCSEIGRPHMRGLPGRALPTLAETMAVNLAAARLTNPDVVCVGAALNTSSLSPEQAREACERAQEELQLPVQDPVAMGVDAIVDRLLQCFDNLSSAANPGR